MKTLLTVSLLLSAFALSNSAFAENAPTTCFIQTANGRYLTDAKKGLAWEKFTLVDSGAGTPNITYGIRTSKGFYLTAVDGGGRIRNVMHSDATKLRDWEKFQFESLGGDYYAIKTYRGNYLTAVGGGGRITDVMHSDAKQVKGWEKFKLRCGIK